MLKQKISTKKAKIAVLGLGYVGLPLAVHFAKAGFFVLGLDTNASRVSRVSSKQNYIADIKRQDLARVINNGRLQARTELENLRDADVIIICVPTPLKRKYTPDIRYILNAVRTIHQFAKKGVLVVLESTTYPGTTEELIQPELEKGGWKLDRDFYLAFSPERISPGDRKYPLPKIPKLVGGLTPESGKLTKALYAQIIDEVHLVSSAKVAEMAKLLENSFRIINIGWINEAAMMCHRMGINVWEVIEAAKTKPFGFLPFYPGLGVGGHCIPDDPLYLFWKAKRHGFSSKYLKLSADVNSAMPKYVVERLKNILPGQQLVGAKILVAGVTYKKNVKDLRKSPSLTLIELLQREKAEVDYIDPYIPYLDLGELDLVAVQLTPKKIAQYDCVVIATDHTRFDYKTILKNAKRIFDTRNVYADVLDKKVVRL